jgi:SWI/SNF-related matrix-associated actin-dependent regulator of chromatin subfamily A-like protein 1
VNTLFAYQVEGAEWLPERKNALLADPMGLGKSAQAIVACDRLNAKTILVVCPASMREVWRHEFNKFSTIDRKIIVLYNGKKPEANAINIASYEGATDKFKKALLDIEFDVGIFDEAHFLKSIKAKRTKAVYGSIAERGLIAQCKHRWMLSGTPAPNNPVELFPMCRSLFPDSFRRQDGRVMSYWDFVGKFCLTKEDGFGKKIIGGKNLGELKARLAPHMLRRKKEDVLKDLPSIMFDTLYLPPQSLSLPAEEEELVRSALASPEPMRALEGAAQHVAKLRRLLGTAKVSALSSWLVDQIEGGLKKVVVFAHHKSVIAGLEAALLGVSDIAKIDGSTPATERYKEVERFQNDPKCKVFIGQLQAAGTGITLTAASELIFAEYSFVPGENEQAAMRVHRIGQKNNVLIRYAVVSDSLDERIAAVVRRKSAVISQVFA